MGSATTFGTEVTDPDEFQRLCHSFGRNHRSGSQLIFIKAVVINKDSFRTLYLYESHYTSTDEVRESVREVSNYGFYVWDSKAIKAIGIKSNESLSKKESY